VAAGGASAGGAGTSGAGLGGAGLGGLGGASAGTAGLGGAGAGAIGECRTPVQELPLIDAWAREVVLGTEFGGGGDDVVRRFASPVTVSMVQGSASQRALLADVIGTLAGILEGTGMSLGMGVDADTSADMRVWFVPYASFSDVAAAEGIEVFPNNLGQFYLYWDGASALTRAYVLIASDLLMGADLVHFTFEEVTQALGPSSDSPLMQDSIFFASGSDGGDAQGPSCYDRALLHLLYAHLEPGDGATEVSDAVSLYWDQR
jgi:hypothetical protein